MVLVMSPGDGQPEPATERPFPIGAFVIAMKGDGRRVVVQFVQLDVKFADRVRHDRQRKCGDVGIEEPVEATADAIIVEREQLSGTQPEEFRDVPRGPLAEPIEWLTGYQQILEQKQETRRGGDAGSTVLAGEVVSKELLEPEPLDEAVEDR